MAEPHAPLADLVAYVDGSLGLSASAALEHHVAECAWCAKRLEREAWIETTGYEVAEHAAPCRPRKQSRVPVVTHLWLAAAAMALLALFRTGPLETAVQHRSAAEATMPAAVGSELTPGSDESAACWAFDGAAVCSAPLLASVAEGAGQAMGEPVPQPAEPSLDESAAEDAESLTCGPTLAPYTPLYGPVSG